MSRIEADFLARQYPDLYADRTDGEIVTHDDLLLMM